MTSDFNKYFQSLKKNGSIEVYDNDENAWESGFADYVLDNYQCIMMEGYILVKNVEVRK